LAIGGLAALVVLGVAGYALTARRSDATGRQDASAGYASAQRAPERTPERTSDARRAEPPQEPAAQLERAAQPAQPVQPAPVQAQPEAEPLAAQEPQPAAAPSQPQGLSSETLTTVLSAGQAGLQRCYEHALVEALTQGAPPPPALHLDVSMTIAKDGVVRSAAIEGKAEESLRACVGAAVRALKFPASDAESSARFPVVFQPAVVGQ
jgi:hypothetical protein